MLLRPLLRVLQIITASRSIFRLILIPDWNGFGVQILCIQRRMMRDFVFGRWPRIRWPYILCRGGCRDDNPKPNHSVTSFTRGAYWTGPLVVFRRGSSEFDPAIIQDVLLDDLPRVIRLLRQIGNGSQVMKHKVFKQSFNTSKCVIIKCRGDHMNASGETQLAFTRVPELHPIFEGQPTNISRLMGIPLIIQKIPREAGRDVVFDEDHLRNDFCGTLHLDTLPHSETWGEIPSQWHENVGTVLVVRQDRKDITTLQLLAIMTYIRLLDLKVVEDEPDVRKKQRFLEGYFTRSKFEEFFFGCFAAALDENPQLDGDLISPYSNSYDSIGISQDSSSVGRAIDLWHRTGLSTVFIADD
ncbi:putative mynd domain protein [Botrytis fragariae]|uniref:Putative mynd domain protein n=1 Tax=Botrytis fragariae TaxID=1964551 RepID=A0A8H6ED58_9HELO|nr:putative mynd domain protein [Botrytis fragariae]KAF5867977.1 putative mynd domain protein [Botrytis fragariae]